MVVTHQFPQPLWKPDGTISYAPNSIELEKMKKDGWSTVAVRLPFPKALHGADGQSLTVRNQEELDRALKNGWSLKPVHDDERSPEAPPSPDHAPRKRKSHKRHNEEEPTI